MKSKALITSGSILLVLSLLVLGAIVAMRGTSGFGENAAGTVMMAGAGLAGVTLLLIGLMRRRTH